MASPANFRYTIPHDTFTPPSPANLEKTATGRRHFPLWNTYPRAPAFKMDSNLNERALASDDPPQQAPSGVAPTMDERIDMARQLAARLNLAAPPGARSKSSSPRRKPSLPGTGTRSGEAQNSPPAAESSLPLSQQDSPTASSIPPQQQEPTPAETQTLPQQPTLPPPSNPPWSSRSNPPWSTTSNAPWSTPSNAPWSAPSNPPWSFPAFPLHPPFPPHLSHPPFPPFHYAPQPVPYQHDANFFGERPAEQVNTIRNQPFHGSPPYFMPHPFSQQSSQRNYSQQSYRDPLAPLNTPSYSSFNGGGPPTDNNAQISRSARKAARKAHNLGADPNSQVGNKEYGTSRRIAMRDTTSSRVNKLSSASNTLQKPGYVTQGQTNHKEYATIHRIAKRDMHALINMLASDDVSAVAKNAPKKGRHGDQKIMTPAPPPLPEYLEQARLAPKFTDSPSTILVILDLNGTLLYRPSRKATKMIERPFLQPFLRYLFQNFKVMVWSSARPENVASLVNQCLDDDLRSLLVARLDRKSFGLSAAHYGQNVQVYKNLQIVWGNTDIQLHHPEHEKGGRFGQHNTVLIDDSVLKANAQPHNLLQITEFSATPAEMKGDVLREVAGYLETLRYQEDV